MDKFKVWVTGGFYPCSNLKKKKIKEITFESNCKSQKAAIH